MSKHVVVCSYSQSSVLQCWNETDTRINRHWLPQRTVRGSWKDSPLSKRHSAATAKEWRKIPVGAKHHISHPNLYQKIKYSNAVLQIKCVGKKKNCCIVPSILGGSGPEVSNATASRVKSLYLGCSLAAGVVWKVRHMSYDSQHGRAESKGGQFLSRQLGACSSDGRLPE